MAWYLIKPKNNFTVTLNSVHSLTESSATQVQQISNSTVTNQPIG